MGKKKTPAPPQQSSRLWPWLLVAAAMLFVAIVRIRLLQIPLERDEGEFAYMGQLMLHGHPPYSLAYNMKLPGIYAAYALIMAIFGQTTGGIHFGFLLVNLAGILMVFLLGRRLMGDWAGAVAAATYAVFAIQPKWLSMSAHASHFVIACALGGLILLLKAVEKDRLWILVASGLLLGVGVLMKQPGVFYVLLGAVYLGWTDLRGKRLPVLKSAGRQALFLAVAALPYGLACLILWKVGVFPRFWFWTYLYARSYGSAVPLSDAWGNLMYLMEPRLPNAGTIWLVGLSGLTVYAWDRGARKHLGFIVGLLLASIAALSTGLYFRPHYFIFMGPVVSLLAGLSVTSYSALLARKTGLGWARVIPAVVLAFVLCLPIYQQKEFFFDMTPGQASRFMYLSNPFPEAVEIGKYLREHTNPSDTVMVFGSEPEIYFYAGRKPATGYIYMYSLTEKQPYMRMMQREMIRDIERNRPKCAVLVYGGSSWLSTTDPDRTMLTWTNDYVQKHYRAAGVVAADPGDPEDSVYTWKGEPLPSGVPSELLIGMLIRKD